MDYPSDMAVAIVSGPADFSVTGVTSSLTLLNASLFNSQRFDGEDQIEESKPILEFCVSPDWNCARKTACAVLDQEDL